MWDALLEPDLALLDGPDGLLAPFLQELSHATLHTRPGAVLWCDSAHAFHPDQFAELNLTRGHSAETHAERMLVRRCLTPFQWYTTLSRHVASDLDEAPTALVLASPFDHPLSTDELADWEQEDYTRFLVPHLRDLARARGIPIVLGVDLARWSRTHPTLAQATLEGAGAHWRLSPAGGRWRLIGADGRVLDPMRRRGTTLLDWLEPEARAVVPVTVPEPARGPFRTRIVHPIARSR